MIHLIQAALERRLLAMPDQLPTAFENLAFSPLAGQPYQRVHTLVNRPIDMDLAVQTREERGVFQVSLFFPLNQGRVPAQSRADALRQWFKPPQTLVEGGVQVLLLSSVQTGSGAPDSDRWHIPVSIYWRSLLSSE